MRARSIFIVYVYWIRDGLGMLETFFSIVLRHRFVRLERRGIIFQNMEMCGTSYGIFNCRGRRHGILRLRYRIIIKKMDMGGSSHRIFHYWSSSECN